MKYQPIDNLVLFGGSRILADFAVYAKQRLPYRVSVFSAKRHLDEKIAGSGKTFRQILKANRIEYFEAQDINREPKLRERVDKASLGMAFGAAWVFEKQTVRRFRPGHLLDFMGIDLPRYRGGAHYTWQILHGNRRGSVNLQVIEGGAESFHRGPIVKRIDVDLSDAVKTPLDYFNSMAKRELEFLKEFFKEVKQGKAFTPRKLSEKESSYYPFLSTVENGWIDWSWTAEQIGRFINAFDEPYAGAGTYLADLPVRLLGCTRLESGEAYHPFTAGLVIRKDKAAVYVAAVGGLLKIVSIKDNQGKAILKRVELGDRFHTPRAKLDEAMAFQAKYNARGLVGGKKR